MTQVIKKPVHVLEISKSCKDVIFTSQSEIVMDSEVHSSLHSHCYHQIVNVQLSNTNQINRAIEIFDWEQRQHNVDVNKQVSVFIKKAINIMSNFVPNEIITCDDWDPPWMNIYKNSYYCKR